MPHQIGEVGKVATSLLTKLLIGLVNNDDGLERRGRLCGFDELIDKIHIAA